MKGSEEKIKVLFSWVDTSEDLKPSKKFDREYKDSENPNIMNGPTLQLMNLEIFDYVHLFYIQDDEKSQNIAAKIKETVRDYRKDFKGNPEISSHPIPVLHPADYENMWHEVPKTVSSIIEKEYKSKDPKIFFNVSSGSPAMTSTWLLMVGSNEFEAEILSPQEDKKKKDVYLMKLDIGTYPHVDKIKDEVLKVQNIIHEFESKQMRDIHEGLYTYSTNPGLSKYPIFITGETGTGKTTIAKKYHEMKSKHKGHEIPWAKVNCGEFKMDLAFANSQLFGHKKGAYTGADSDYEGTLKAVDGGIVFFDEIGDIPMQTQNLLLDAIEGKSFRPLGSHIEVNSDFQVICATNKDIDGLIATNELRHDFVARIKVIDIEIPPLRERRGDIKVILEGLLKPLEDFNFEDTAKNKLLSHLRGSTLPENIRSIEKIVARLEIRSKKLPEQLLTSSEVDKYFKEHPEPTQDDEFTKTIEKLLALWPNTTFNERGDKWKDTIIRVAVQKLSARSDYRKGGKPIIHQISKTLGIDDKTINKILGFKVN